MNVKTISLKTTTFSTTTRVFNQMLNKGITNPVGVNRYYSEFNYSLPNDANIMSAEWTYFANTTSATAGRFEGIIINKFYTEEDIRFREYAYDAYFPVDKYDSKTTKATSVKYMGYNNGLYGKDIVLSKNYALVPTNSSTKPGNNAEMILNIHYVSAE